MDMKKEIKLSDLFKRKPKDTADETVAVDEEKPKKEKGSGMKREISFRRRKGGDDAEPKEKAPKEPKRKRSRGAAKAAPAVPQVPLMRAFNLLPKDVAGEADGRRPTTPQLGIAVAGLVLVALLGAMFLLSSARVADKQQTLDGLKGQLADLNVAAEKPQPGGESDEALVQERGTRTGALSVALAGRIAWDRFLRDVSLVLPQDVWLTSLTGTSGTAPKPAADPTAAAAAASATTFELGGIARDQQGVAQFLSRLQVLPEVESVQLKSATAATVEDQEVFQFVIAGVVKPQTVAGGTTS
jgi:Tfp pilus assembly protein PilN